MTQLETIHRLRDAVDDLRRSSGAYASGQTSEEEFVESLLLMDAQRVQPLGATLCVSHTSDGWVSVLMKDSSSGRLWAAFEFLPESSRVRRLGTLAQYRHDQHPR